MFSTTFNALLKESAFAYEILGSGVTQIRRANYAKKGIYYQAFINLTVGLERIGKLFLLLDYYIQNNGSFPDERYLKKEIGHNIEKLYLRSIEIKKKYNFKFAFIDNLDDQIYQNIIKILSEFAMTDRYENLNILVNAKQENNPIQQWYENVDMLLFQKCVTKRKKEQIIQNACVIDRLVSPYMLVMHSGEDGSTITEVGDASMRTGIYEAVCPYRQLYVAHIIRFWTELLWELQYKAMSLGKEDIPFFSDMFGCFYNNDSYLKTRKNYENC